jgi:hypothetical protein
MVHGKPKKLLALDHSSPPLYLFSPAQSLFTCMKNISLALFTMLKPMSTN